MRLQPYVSGSEGRGNAGEMCHSYFDQGRGKGEATEHSREVRLCKHAGSENREVQDGRGCGSKSIAKVRDDRLNDWSRQDAHVKIQPDCQAFNKH